MERHPIDAGAERVEDTTSLTNYELEDVGEISRLLSGVTVGRLRAFIEMRKAGPANDMLTILYDAHFADWHVENGRQVGVPYEAGQLYGALLAETQFVRMTHRRLLAHDPSAYQVAEGAVNHSYGLAGAAVAGDASPWRTEEAREYVMTRGSHLAVSCRALDVGPGALSDDIPALLRGEDVADNDGRLVFYRG